MYGCTTFCCNGSTRGSIFFNSGHSVITLEKRNTLFLVGVYDKIYFHWRGHAVWNSSFYVAQTSSVCSNLERCDQFAVAAFRAFSVKIVGIANSTVRIRK